MLRTLSAATSRMRKTSRSRVLVVEDVENEAKLLIRALADAGFSNIVHKATIENAIKEINANPPRLVVTDLRFMESTGLELTRHIRTLDKTQYVYVIMLTSSGNDATLSQCFEAGVDDFVEKPFRADTIVSRLRAGERILGLETNLRAKSRELETALRRIDISAAQRALARAAEVAEAAPAAGETPLDALLGTETWRELENHLAKAMTDFFQLPFASTGTREDRGEPFVAEVALSDPSKQLELGLSVVVDTGSMKRLGAALLGDEDLEGAQALVLEVANSLMGTLKTSFTAHGFSFTGGIPTTEPFGVSRAAFDKSNVRSRMALAANDNDLELWLRVKEKPNTTMKGRSLREGLVIGEDIRDNHGIVLIKRGSRLTRTAAERLAKVVPDLDILVSDPSAA